MRGRGSAAWVLSWVWMSLHLRGMRIARTVTYMFLISLRPIYSRELNKHVLLRRTITMPIPVSRSMLPMRRRPMMMMMMMMMPMPLSPVSLLLMLALRRRRTLHEFSKILVRESSCHDALICVVRVCSW
ncbi:hypothetical protein BZA70DRAFT_662 [Myxozyma melibiosi]|uniref:Secreted protein n=1 Tax=Myxozyma melibiosi TaxID=54550 RepID=A0ABR1FAX5_9ASCO